MKIHPIFQDPNAVLVIRTPLTGPARWDDFRRAAEEAMQIIGVELEGENVAIKPNVTSGERFADPDTGIITHPGFVQGITEYLQGHGAGQRSRVTIIEDPRNTDDNAPRNWTGTGYERVSQATGARLHTPTAFTCVKKRVPGPLSLPQIKVSRLAAAENTILINVPKLKTHNLSITTLCMKNLMGLVSVFDRHYCHQAWQELPEEAQEEQRPRQVWMDRAMHERWQDGLARRLVDTARVLCPALNIVEGVVGREGTGFQRGRNRPLGLVIAGVNMVAVDSIASYIMGFDPQQLVYLRTAAGAGLGENDLQKLQVLTEQRGEIIPCGDIAPLRVSPPMRVISGILGEEPDPFQQEQAPGESSVFP